MQITNNHTDPFVVVAFYKFVTLTNYQQMREPLRSFCAEHGVKGTILLAHEGINSTIAGTRAGIDTVLKHFRSDPRLTDLEWKESYTSKLPFYRMKVRLKKEIVAMGVPWEDPDTQVGTYVPPEQWNELISDPDIILIDTRNDYEVKLGTFKGAVNPETHTFRQFPEFTKEQLDREKHKKVAMFCTGGIRCEKASAYLVKQGFEEVYHLQGGILKYLETVPKEESMWEGECFVFDNRVTVDHELHPGASVTCYSCWTPLTAEDIESPQYEEGVSCPNCFDSLNEEKKERLRERQKQIVLARQRGEEHMGMQFPNRARTERKEDGA